MHLTLTALTIMIVVALVIMAFCLWLSLRIFGLKPGRSNLIKIVGLEVTFLTATSLSISVVKGGVAALFSLLFLIGGFVLWVMLLRRFVASKYSMGRAIGSYITSYVFALVLSVIVAIMFVTLVAQVFRVDGDSMTPALQANTTVLVYKFEKHPSDNAVIVYQTPSGVNGIGRVRGTPGQSVSVQGGYVKIGNNIQKLSSYTLSASQYYVAHDNATFPPRIISSSDIVGTIGPKL